MKKLWIKRVIAVALAMVLVFTSMPEIAQAKSNSQKLSVTVTTQEELNAALKMKDVSSILIKTSEKIDLKIKKGDYTKVKLTIESPKAAISNYGSFSQIVIKSAKRFYEAASGNDITVYDNKLYIKIAKKAIIQSLYVNKENASITVTNKNRIEDLRLRKTCRLDLRYGTVGKLTVNAPSEILLKGTTEVLLPVTVKKAGEGTTISTTRPVKVNAYGDFNLVTENGAENSTVKLKRNTAGVSIVNNSEGKVTITGFDGAKATVNAGDEHVSEFFDLKDDSSESDKIDDSGNGSGTDAGSGSGSGSGSGTGSGSGSDNDPGTGSGSGSDNDPGTGSGSGSDNDPGTGSGSGSDSDPGTGSGSGSDSDPGTGSGSGSDNDPGSSDSDPEVCKLSFALADGCTLDAQLPETREYKAGAEIGKLPNAYITNGIFGGWYYDSAMTKPVKAKDTINESMTIYGELTMAAEKQIIETPQYAVVEVPEDKVSSFSFEIKDYTDGCIEKFINSASAENVTYKVESGKVIPQLQKGKTYTVRLTEDCTAQYVIDGVEKGVTAKELTITTEKEEVLNLSVSDDIVFVPVKEVSNLNGLVFDGLFSTAVDSNGNLNTKENKYEGSFSYAGDSIKVGDTVAIYEGKRPDKRDFSGFENGDNGGVAYVNITEKNGNTYSFKTADSQDVLKKPEVLPVSRDEDKDGKSDHSITVDASVFDFSDPKYAQLGYDSSTTVDEGDFLLFYTGSFATASNASYAKVTKVSKNGTDFVVEYVDSTEDEVLASMDMYNSRKSDINLSDEEINTLQKNLEDQALASGFLDDAADYLVALALETDGFKELSDDLDLDLNSYNIQLADGTKLTDSDMALMDNGSEAKITKKEVKAYITPGYRLQMFEGYSGLRIELVMTLTVTIGEQDEKKDHLELELQACFEEEILFGIDIDGGAVWEWAGIFPYIDDYEVSASLDWGTAVCAGITATLKTVKGKEDPFNWKNVTGFSAEDSILDIGKQLTTLMSEKEQFMGETILDENGEEVEATSNAGGLVDKYKAFMENAQKDECWVTIVEKEIFDTEGVVDPLGIIVYGISAKFVVKMNLYITVGATYESGEGTRYSFYMRIWDRVVKTSETPIMEPHVNYDFYVFGTLGIKVGLEFEFGVGLFSLKLDSVGITAEVGVYFTIAGYFYAHYSMTEKNGKIEKESSLSGALSMEIGIYLEIKFKAQLFSSKKLTYEPTLLEKSWPIWTLGEPENVIGFVDLYEDDDEDKPSGDFEDYDDVIEMVWDIEYVFPEEYFQMDVLDLFSGESKENIIEPKDREERFTFKMSNDKFRIVPEQNTIYMTAKKGTTDREECDLTIIWNGAPLAFTTKPIERKIKIIWKDPINARFISFNSDGGSIVKTIALASGTAITEPEAPTKTGYDFGGWFEKNGSKFVFPATMPNYESGGVTVKAKWIPRDDTKYTVNYYKQGTDGRYALEDTEIRKGTTDSTPSIDELQKSYDNCFLKTYTINAIRPDGSSIMSIYYALNNCDVTFSFGEMKDGTYKTNDIKYTVKYGSKLLAPGMNVAGYVFDGYDGLTTDEDGNFTVTKNESFTAKWKVADDTPYSIEHYVYNPGLSEYELEETVIRKGTTGSPIDITEGRYTNNKYVFVSADCVNTDEVSPTIGANGDTVIKFYYNRNKFSLSFMDGDAAIGSPADIVWGALITKPVDPVKKGYVFDAWYKDKSCTSDKLFDFEKDTMPAEKFALYAGWKSSNSTAYTVEYYGQKADDATQYIRMDSDTFFDGTTDKEVSGIYKPFEHYVNNESYAGRVDRAVVAADGSTVLKLYYDRKTVTVSFDANGGTLGADGASKTFRYGEAFNVTSPVRSGYAFVGWYLGDDKYEASIVVEENDFKLTAHWEAGQVNYNAEHYIMDTNEKYPELANFTDYTLSGIVDAQITLSELKKEDQEVEDGIVFDHAEINGKTATTATVSEGMTVKLFYKRIANTLTWNLNNEIPVNNDSYTHGSVLYEAPIVAPNMSKKGYIYTFSGIAPAQMPNYDLTYTVSCRPIGYKIQFNKNFTGANQYMTEMEFTYDQNADEGGVTLSKNTFTRQHYTFAGWADSPNGSKVYGNEAKILNITDVDGAVITLYAVWEGDIYDISYNLANEEAKFARTEDEIKKYEYGTTVTLPVPVLNGYRFKGWYLSSETDPVEVLTPEFVQNHSNLEFTAKWEEAVYSIVWDVNGKDKSNSDVSKLEGGKKFTNSQDTKYNDYLTDGYSTSGKHVERVGNSNPAIIYAPFDPKRTSSVEFEYVFDGWYTELIPDSDASDKSHISDASEKSRSTYARAVDDGDYMVLDDTYVTGDMTFHAHWIKIPREYPVHWYTNYSNKDGRVATDDDRALNENNVALNSIYDLGVQYLINHNGGARFTGDSDYDTSTVTYSPGKATYGTEIVTPVCFKSDYDSNDADYIFKGWYNVNDCENDYSTHYILKNTDAVPLTVGDMLTQDKLASDGKFMFVAIWEKLTKGYLISWNGNSQDTQVTLSGEYTSKNGVTVLTGTQIVAPTAQREPSTEYEYTFDGWYTEPTGGDKIENFGTVEGTAEYFAHWNMKPRYNAVRFMYMNGEGTKTVNVRYGESLDKADTQHPNQSGTDRNIDGYNADYPEVLKAAYTNVGGKYVIDQYYEGSGTFRGWYVCNANGKPIKADGTVTDIASACSWEEYYAVEDNHKIIADVIVKAKWDYDFWILGKQLTSYGSKEENLLPASIKYSVASGYIFFDAETRTLTFDRLNIAVDAVSDSQYIKSQNGIASPILFNVKGGDEMLKINLVGGNSIDVLGNGNSVAGMFIEGPGLEIIGTGFLEVYAKQTKYGSSVTTASKSADNYGFYIPNGNYVQKGSSDIETPGSSVYIVVGTDAGNFLKGWNDRTKMPDYVGDESNISTGIKLKDDGEANLDCSGGYGELLIYAPVNQLGYGIDGKLSMKGSMEDIAAYVFGHRAIKGGYGSTLDVSDCSCSVSCKHNETYTKIDGWNFVNLSEETCNFFFYCKEIRKKLSYYDETNKTYYGREIWNGEDAMKDFVKLYYSDYKSNNDSTWLIKYDQFEK